MFSSKGIRTLLDLRRFIHVDRPHRARKLPDPWDLMTGKELFIAKEYAKGNHDPFDIIPMRRGPGTKECPNVVRSFNDKRIVGCVCHEDSTSIVWFWLHEGFPRRCDCNHWFVLEKVEFPKPYTDCE